MKKGYIGPGCEGFLHGCSEAINIVAEKTEQRSAGIEAIFYSTAFQAGIDEFLVHNFEDRQVYASEFVSERTRFLEKDSYSNNFELVDNAFSAYLPDDWKLNDDYDSVRRLKAFIVELLDAMAYQASLLLPWGIPDISEVESQLPSELAVPISMLLSSIVDVQTQSPFLQKVITTNNVHRFNEIISSDIFSQYVEAQAELDVSDAPLEKTLSLIASKSRGLFSTNRHVLKIKKSSAGILQITPKIIDAVFGKLPGAISDIAAKHGLNMLESQRRIVIYDFKSSIQNILISKLVGKGDEAGSNS